MNSAFVAESTDDTFAGQIHEVIGNTFACAAISRNTLEKIGPLNQVEFPNGYNDVEFCLRARQKGFRHVYLGHLLVHHVPGTSRGYLDESFQRLMLRFQTSEYALDTLFQLEKKAFPIFKKIFFKSLVRRIHKTAFYSIGSHLLKILRTVFRSCINGLLPPSPYLNNNVLSFSMETLSACPGCGSQRFKQWRIASDKLFNVSNQFFPYSYCKVCGLYFSSKRPTQESISLFYPRTYDPYLTEDSVMATTDVSSSEVERFLMAVDNFCFRWLRRNFLIFLQKMCPEFHKSFLKNFILPQRKGDIMLDFGCGSPNYLDSAQEKGWRTIGMDLIPSVLKNIHQRGHEAYLVSSEGWGHIPDATVDAVRLNHVLEHLYDPHSVFLQLLAKMKPGAALHIAVPNPEGLSSRLFKSNWYGLECPRHIMHYSPRNLKSLLQKYGFTDIQLIHEKSTKDFARSLGYWLYNWTGIQQCNLHRKTYAPLLHEWLEPLLWLAGSLGFGDRIQIFARKAAETPAMKSYPSANSHKVAVPSLL